MSNLRKVLVDTNIWIEFLKQPLPELGELIAEERVVTHPCVIGEVLVGNVQQRPAIRQFLLSLPLAVGADFTEVGDSDQGSCEPPPQTSEPHSSRKSHQLERYAAALPDDAQLLLLSRIRVASSLKMI